MLLFRDYTPSNELRYLVIADEALRDGHFFAFYNQGIVYADKPPLYLWIIMASKSIFGVHSMLWLGLFSIIPAFVILYIMNKWAQNEMPRMVRVTAQMMLISTGYFLGAMAVLRMDMLMAMFIVLALYTFYRIYQGDKRKKLLWFLPLYVFGALFTKGPYGVMIPLASILAFLLIEHKIKSVGKYLGWRFWVIVLGLSCAWFGCVYAEGGNTYLNDLLFNQTVHRAVNSFSHSKGFLFYFTTFPYCFAPWSILYLIIFIMAIYNKIRLNTLQKFFAVTIVTTWIMLSCVSSKLEIYLLPIYPFVVFLAVSFIGEIGHRAWIRAGVLVPIAIYMLAFPVVIILPIIISVPEWLFSWPIYASCGILLVMGCGAALELFSSENVYRSIQVLATGLFMAAAVGSFIIPQLNNDIGYGLLAEQGKEMKKLDSTQRYLSYDVSRASGMEYYLGENVEEITLKELKQRADGGERAVLFLKVSDITKNDTLNAIAGVNEGKRVGRYCVLMINKKNGN